jgi:GT2 family glycosyltransferase
MGIALGYTGIAGHPGRLTNPEISVPHNCYQVSAVTFACAVLQARIYWELEGLDEQFPSGFNDVDISIRAMNKGLRNIVCHRSTLIHHESQTRPRSLTAKGFSQAAKDVLVFFLKHRDGLTERFFTR